MRPWGRARRGRCGCPDSASAPTPRPPALHHHPHLELGAGREEDVDAEALAEERVRAVAAEDAAEEEGEAALPLHAPQPRQPHQRHQHRRRRRPHREPPRALNQPKIRTATGPTKKAHRLQQNDACREWESGIVNGSVNSGSTYACADGTSEGFHDAHNVRACAGKWKGPPPLLLPSHDKPSPRALSHHQVVIITSQRS